jgi:hypothetical protein
VWSKTKKPEVLNGDGRWLIQAPEGYLGKTVIDGRYVYRYRYVMEQKIGRLLMSDEIVHHINGDKTDDRPENLELSTKEEHSKMHMLKDRPSKKINLICSNCRKSFIIELRNYKAKKKNNQENFFCSRSCQVRFQHKSHPVE